MPGAIEQLVQVLSQFPDAPLSVEQRESSVVITPTMPDCFAVSLYDQGETTMVAADRWHAHYDEPAQAAYCAIWLLTPYYRLVHELKSGVLVAVWVESWGEGGWEGFDPVFFMNPEYAPDWEADGTVSFARRYVQQAVLPPPADYSVVCPDAELDDSGLPIDSHLGSRLIEVDRPLGPTLFEPVS